MKKILIKILLSHVLFLSAFSNPLDPCDPRAIQRIYQMFKDVNDLFSVCHIHYWVDSGTLLGAVRHNGLIPWDDDLDLCMLQDQEQKFLDLIYILQKFGYRVVGMPYGYKIYPIDGEPMANRPWKHPSCDIFIVLQKNDKFYYKMHWNQEKTAGIVYMKAEELFPLRSYVFGPLVVSGPNNPYPYLDRWYGYDWSTIACGSYDHKLGKPVAKVSKTLTDEDRKPALPYLPLNANLEKYELKHWPDDFCEQYLQHKKD